MSAAQDDEQIRIVAAAFGARHYVMDIDEHALVTPGNDATLSVAPHDEPAHRRRHVLPRALGPCAHVGARVWLVEVSLLAHVGLGVGLAHVGLGVGLAHVGLGAWFVDIHGGWWL